MEEVEHDIGITLVRLGHPFPLLSPWNHFNFFNLAISAPPPSDPLSSKSLVDDVEVHDVCITAICIKANNASLHVICEGGELWKEVR